MSDTSLWGGDALGSDESAESQRAEALEQFLSAGGRYPGVAAELRRSRLAEVHADYTQDASPAPEREREHASAQV